MNCPNCKQDSVILLHTDMITCDDCNSEINIDYCLCEACFYSFRNKNGEFLDGGMADDIEVALDELADTLESEMFGAESEDFFQSEECMSDLLNHCVRCGVPCAVFNEKENSYECPVCGFEWEILQND
jgi:hypothetical protein